MKRTVHFLLITLAAWLLGGEARAQLKIDAELRPRAELNNGFKYLRDTNDLTQVYVTQRTRLGFSYEKDGIRLRVKLQDVRTWGGEDIATSSGVFGSQRGVDLYEGWLELPLGRHLSLRAGRQELKYDDERLLAIRNWNQYGITYDALRLRYARDRWQVDATASWNASDAKILGVTDGTDEYYAKRMRMLDLVYVKRELGEKSWVSFMSLLTGFQHPDYKRVLNMTSTSGLHLDYRRGAMDGMGNAYVQLGSNMYGKKTQAWMLTVSGGYRQGAIRWGAGADVLSGHDPEREEVDYQQTDHTFDIFYGIRFRYLGWMNQFSNVDASTGGRGLLDLYPNLSWYPGKEHELQFFLHFFRNQYEGPSPVGDGTMLEAGLGREYDLMYTWKVKEDLKFQAGFSWYDPSDTFLVLRGQDAGSHRNTWWTWAMLCYTPRLM